MKEVIITGHTGFLGQNLIDSLVEDNFRVTGISKRKIKDGRIKQIKKNIKKISAKDIKNKSTIIHLAATTDVIECEKNPVECFKINVEGTQRILEIAKIKQCNVIFPSTSHVYGYPKKNPISEDHPLNATSIYAASKIAGEMLCQAYAETFKMNVSVFRLFSAYGPKNSDYKVESRIISQLLLKNKIILGNLSPKRDFIYIADAVNAIKIIMNHTKKFQVFNIGTGKSNSIKEICSILGKISNKKMNIQSNKNKSRSKDIPLVQCNSKKLQRLGWRPKTRLETGLKITYEWHKENLKNYTSKVG